MAASKKNSKPAKADDGDLVLVHFTTNVSHDNREYVTGQGGAFDAVTAAMLIERGLVEAVEAEPEDTANADEGSDQE